MVFSAFSSRGHLSKRCVSSLFHITGEWLPFLLGLLLSGTPDEKPWFRVVVYRFYEPWAPVEEGSRILVRLHIISLD